MARTEVKKVTMFYGMMPWGIESEIIYCQQTAIGDVDLHNAADFLGAHESEDGHILTLQFRTMEEQTPFGIRFENVTDLEIKDKPNYHPGDKSLFYAFHSLGDGLFEFEAATMEGKLKATGVVFDVAG
ncbi:hypothetical protein [Streptomyces lavendofoliae]|nr:hypothetical protein [Streptomyces lavendofoliae]